MYTVSCEPNSDCVTKSLSCILKVEIRPGNSRQERGTRAHIKLNDLK